MKRLFLSLIALFLTLSCFAQLEVKPGSFKKVDGFVNVNPDIQTDDNDVMYAVIKVKTEFINDKQRHELLFQGNAATFIELEYKVGEVWVYLSSAPATFLKISHPDFSSTEFWFPFDLQPKQGYEMVLTNKTGPAGPVKDVTNYLIIKADQENAAIYIDDEFAGEKEVYRTFKGGEKHTWRIECELYHDDAGEAIIPEKEGENLTIEKILRPAFGYLNVTSTPEDGAIVYIDGKKVGQTPYKSERLTSGEHKVRVVKEMFATVEKTFTVTDGITVEAPMNMSSNFVNVTVTTDSESDIYVDNEKKGKGSWIGRLSEGLHNIEAKKESHKTSTKTVQITLGKDENIVIPNPEPICGTIDIVSDPIGAKIIIDGIDYGTTPRVLTNVIIGEHRLVLETANASIAKTFVVDETNKLTINEKLQQNITKTKNSKYDATSFENRTFTVNGYTFDMIAVKGGTFTMGCVPKQGEDCRKNSLPAHSVTLSDYYIGKYEVTREFYNAVMGLKSTDIWPQEVNWYRALDFISELNQLTGLSFRFPTEAEWEYAAKGGNKSRGYKYSGSDNVDEVAWYYISYGNSPRGRVGQKKPNELGIYDMSGNVAEWCQDWMGDYSSDNQTDPQGPVTGTRRVLRGGSYGSFAEDSQVTSRKSAKPDENYSYGLRIVLDGDFSIDYDVSNQENSVEPVLKGIFSVSENDKVRFSKGNLGYYGTWRFAKHQWDIVGAVLLEDGTIYQPSEYSLLGWGTSGYYNNDHFNYPTERSTNPKDYGDGSKDLSGTNFDWGVYANIVNAKDIKWRTLTNKEWDYIFEKRATVSGIRYAKATVNGVRGVVLLPDDWSSSYYDLKETNNQTASFSSNIILKSYWTNNLEVHGAVFLPCVGKRYGSTVTNTESEGCYWSATHKGGKGAYYLNFNDSSLNAMSVSERCEGFSVRLVCPAED